jgi:uncharacterized membrane protein YeaQ/YmgE (transglycosylase-associated protein family)
MGLLAWIIVGALAGWVISLLGDRNRERGWRENIFLGITGAVLGGVLFSLLTGRPTYLEFQLNSVLVAGLGAFALLFLLRVLRRT